MTNIWGFLLWTLTLTVVALFLLLLKAIFRDKLSPRWQYGIWGLLALRAILPMAGTNRYILVDLPYWIQAIKIDTEKGLGSVYSERFSELGNPWFLPQISGMPNSVTDWLFVIYAAGVLAVLASYIIGYARLRMLLKQGKSAGTAVTERIKEVCEKYNLKSCKVVMVSGISSAFVCGIASPVLVLPADGGETCDEKILLHELLHLKYKDGLQSVFWSLLRAFNWCNPVMQYVCNRIGNDMEALCDQRVLERLEGEERREYGRILLSMTNEKYSRAFGTTSLSNGGKNIARRIDCIARFKKYPRGMRLVSICIAVILVQPIFIGVAAEGTAAYGTTNSGYIFTGTPNYLNYAKIQNLKCTTLAGAIDTYAKGIILRDGYYLALAAPKDKQEELLEFMEEHNTQDIDVGVLGDFAPVTTMFNYAEAAYYVCNLYENGGTYYGDLVLPMSNAEIDGVPYYGKDYVMAAFAIQPIKVYEETETGRWIVEPLEDLRAVPYTDISFASFYMTSVLESGPIATYYGESDKGTLEAKWATVYMVDNDVTGGTSWMDKNNVRFNSGLKVDAHFDRVNVDGRVEYTSKLSDEERMGISAVTLETAVWNSAEDEGKGWENPESIDEEREHMHFFNTGIGSSTNGTSYITETFQELAPDGEKGKGYWQGKLSDVNLGNTYFYEPELSDYFGGGDELMEVVPYAIACKLYFEGESVDYIVAHKEGGK